MSTELMSINLIGFKKDTKGTNNGEYLDEIRKEEKFMSTILNLNYVLFNFL